MELSGASEDEIRDRAVESLKQKRAFRTQVLTWVGVSILLIVIWALTGDAAGQRRILDTSVPGVFAVGDVRSGSVKRCATAVGEGAMVVRFVHERMTGGPPVAAPTRS